MLAELFLNLSLVASPSLAEIDDFVSLDSFESAFRVGDRVETEQRSCVGPKCDSLRMQMRVRELRADSVVIESASSNGKSYREEIYSRAAWESTRHNRVRAKLEQMQSFGLLAELREIKSSERQLNVNGESLSIPTRQILIEASNAVGLKIRLTMEIAAGLGGLAQVLESTERKSFGHDGFKILDVQSAP